ncbi:MAG: hypothetical protein JSS55_18245 [Proteobacteria bacterium]|nr:hypothetical protein [Pseudomonadota bacterium]
MRALPVFATIGIVSAGLAATQLIARDPKNEAAAELSADGQTFGDGAKVAGPAKTCVPLNQIRNSHVLSDRVIDFDNGTRSSTTYRVVLPQGCPQLGFEQRFAYETSLTQLCAQDIITVLQSPGITRGASCGLAAFQPITPAPRRK